MELSENQKEICKKAIYAFGSQAQVIKAIEEFSELQKELCKFLLHSNTINFDNIVDEMADVIIMNYQLKKIFDKLEPNFHDLLSKKIEFKTLRLKNTIENMF